MRVLYHPYCSVRALTGLPTQRPRPVCVGTFTGVRSAVAGNIPVIALTVGHPRAKLEAAGATHTVDSFWEVAKLVRESQGE